MDWGRRGLGREHLRRRKCHRRWHGGSFGFSVQLGQPTLSFIGRQQHNLGLLLCLGRFSLGEGKAKRLGQYVAFNNQQIKCVGVGIDFNLLYIKCIGLCSGDFDAACRLRSDALAHGEVATLLKTPLSGLRG